MSHPRSGRRWFAVAAMLLTACGSGDGGTTTAAPTRSTSSAPAETTTSVAAAESTTTTIAATTTPPTTTTAAMGMPEVDGYQVYPVPPGSHPHDVAPSPDGSVWYTGQHTGVLGRLDPDTGEIEEVPLGAGSAPHGVIVGPDGVAWVTDGGLNAIVRVDPETLTVDTFPLPGGDANLNTATFDGDGVLWFTGQNGVYGRLDPVVGEVETFPAPRGSGPYGITTTPSGEVYYASLAGSHIASIDRATGAATPIDPPTPGQGARRVWSDSTGAIWVAEWNSGQVARYRPDPGDWDQWRLPGDNPATYAVYVDELDLVWLTDFGGDHALVRFDPATEAFDAFPLPVPGGAVRQLLGRPGEVWGAMSAADALVVMRY